MQNTDTFACLIGKIDSRNRIVNYFKHEYDRAYRQGFCTRSELGRLKMHMTNYALANKVWAFEYFAKYRNPETDPFPGLSADTVFEALKNGLDWNDLGEMDRLKYEELYHDVKDSFDLV